MRIEEDEDESVEMIENLHEEDDLPQPDPVRMSRSPEKPGKSAKPPERSPSRSPEKSPKLPAKPKGKQSVDIRIQRYKGTMITLMFS